MIRLLLLEFVSYLKLHFCSLSPSLLFRKESCFHLIKWRCCTDRFIFQWDILVSLMFVLGNCIWKWKVVLKKKKSFNDAIYINHSLGQEAHLFPEGSNFWRVGETEATSEVDPPGSWGHSLPHSSPPPASICRQGKLLNLYINTSDAIAQVLGCWIPVPHLWEVSWSMSQAACSRLQAILIRCGASSLWPLWQAGEAWLFGSCLLFKHLFPRRMPS